MMNQNQVKQNFKAILSAVRDEKPATAREIMNTVVKDRVMDIIDNQIKPEIADTYSTK